MINFQTAVDELTKVVTDAGEDTVYEKPTDERDYANTMGCLYVHRVAGTYTPGCVMGRWLHAYHGIALENLAQMDGVGGIEEVLSKLGIEVTSRARVFLRSVQFVQDRGTAWGEALAYARECTSDWLNDDITGG